MLYWYKTYRPPPNVNKSEYKNITKIFTKTYLPRLYFAPWNLVAWPWAWLVAISMTANIMTAAIIICTANQGYFNLIIALNFQLNSWRRNGNRILSVDLKGGGIYKNFGANPESNCAVDLSMLMRRTRGRLHALACSHFTESLLQFFTHHSI